ncbi:MAG: FlaD/FlaE family flagellar protein [Thermoplasmatota archaeon]
MSEAPSDEQLRRALKDDAAAKPAKKAKPKRGRRPRRKGKAEAKQAEEPTPPAPEPESESAPPEPAGDPTPEAPRPEDAPEMPEAPEEPESDAEAELRAQEMDELRRQLADMRDQMEAMSAAKDQIEGVAQKFNGMEDRMGNLLQLSELLSIQYNPFLEDTEEQVFEGRHEADELIQSLREKKRDRRPGSEVVRPDLDTPVPLDAEPEAAPVPDEPPAESPAQAPAPHPEPAEVPTYQPPPPARYVPAPQPPVAPVGRSREAYLALCWLEHLTENAPEGAAHLLLDHYRRLGWVGEDDYTWLSVLAHSVSVPTEIAWSDFELSGPDMARFHRENMTFLDRLFHQGFEERDPGRWQHQARRWLGGD